jgi:hypothetical protein
VVDHLNFYAVDLSTGYQNPGILYKDLVRVAKVLKDVQNYIGESSNLLATFEGKLLGLVASGKRRPAQRRQRLL